ncbi:D-methionine ABC transporter, permease protein [Streptococcus infantarius subsp. infantarius ATCC BAA-102]|uniref:D-methionine ABC transporter, permease protein n=1 Tax=Streptococcus infantarius subsp. infantarius ATCC BAA-102 TaxID=471872 RepID=A0ABP2DFM3_9STRE|nr:D-methionine ABC transporter, permease protein [Streptococcus infantarius subsp. infantarius ATCC BAA-102]
MIEWISTNMPDVYRIGWEGTNSWSDAFSATIYMTGWSFVIGGLLGLVMGLFLVLTGPNGVLNNRFGFKFWIFSRQLFVPFHLSSCLRF